MRPHSAPTSSLPVGTPRQHTDSDTLRRLLPYLWHYKWRVMAAAITRHL